MSSLAKAAIATGFLAVVFAASFSWGAIALYALALALGYSAQLPERRLVRTSFVLVIVLGLVGAAFLESSVLVERYGWLVRGALLGVFYVAAFFLFGLMNLSFKRRLSVYSTLSTIVLFSAGLLFFAVNQPTFSHYPSLVQLSPFILFLLVGALSYESLQFTPAPPRAWGLTAAFVPRSRRAVLAVTLGFVAAELSVLELFLPLGFVNAAVLFALVLSLAQGALSAHLEGTLTPPFVLRSLTLLVVLFVLVLAFSKWSV